jgi:hypothetical protein
MKQPRGLKIGRSYSVAFSPDGSRLATLGRDVVLWDLPGRKKTWRSHPFSHPSHFAFSPDGSLLAVKNTAGHIVILDAATGETVRDFRNEEDGEGSRIEFSPCGRYLIDGSWGGVFSVREVESGQLEFRQGFPNEMLTWLQCIHGRQSWVVSHPPRATSHMAPPAPDYFSLWPWPFSRSRFITVPRRFPFLRAAAAVEEGSYLAAVHGAPPTNLEVIWLGDGVTTASTGIDAGGSGLALRWSCAGTILGSLQASGAVFYKGSGLTWAGEVTLPFPSDIAFSPQDEWVALGSWSAGLLLPLGNAISASGSQ